MADDVTTTINPKGMGDCLINAIHVIDSVDQKVVPPFMFKQCAGLLLLSAREVGVAIVSSQSGAGVAVKHNKDGSWSAPLAVSLGSFGMGAVFGYANQDVLVVLNHFAMDRLIQGQGQLQLGADFGFAAGRMVGGGSAGAEIGMSDKAGFGTSFVYTFSKGVFVNAEVQTAFLVAVQNLNEAAYKKSNPSDILGGNVDIPPKGGQLGDLISELHTKLAQHSEKE